MWEVAWQFQRNLFALLGLLVLLTFFLSLFDSTFLLFQHLFLNVTDNKSVVLSDIFLLHKSLLVKQTCIEVLMVLCHAAPSSPCSSNSMVTLLKYPHRCLHLVLNMASFSVVLTSKTLKVTIIYGRSHLLKRWMQTRHPKACEFVDKASKEVFCGFSKASKVCKVFYTTHLRHFCNLSFKHLNYYRWPNYHLPKTTETRPRLSNFRLQVSSTRIILLSCMRSFVKFRWQVKHALLILPCLAPGLMR